MPPFLWGMIIYPILNRGSVAVSFSNTTDMAFTIVKINEQDVDFLLEAGGSTTMDYDIQGEERIVVSLRDEIGTEYTQEVTDSFSGLVNPENYGRALVTLKEKKGEIQIKVLNNIS